MSEIIRVEVRATPGAKTYVTFPTCAIKGEVVACVVEPRKLVSVVQMQVGNIVLLLNGFGPDGIPADELAELPISLPIEPALLVHLVVELRGESEENVRATISIVPRVDPPRPPPPVPYAFGMVPQIPRGGT